MRDSDEILTIVSWVMLGEAFGVYSHIFQDMIPLN